MIRVPAGRQSGRSSIYGVGNLLFSSLNCQGLFWGPAQPRFQWVAGAVSATVKRPRSESDHSPLSGAEANIGSYISTPPARFCG